MNQDEEKELEKSEINFFTELNQKFKKNFELNNITIERNLKNIELFRKLNEKQKDLYSFNLNIFNLYLTFHESFLAWMICSSKMGILCNNIEEIEKELNRNNSSEFSIESHPLSSLVLDNDSSSLKSEFTIGKKLRRRDKFEKLSIKKRNSNNFSFDPSFKKKKKSVVRISKVENSNQLLNLPNATNNIKLNK